MRRFLALIAVFALFLAACGSGDSDDAGVDDDTVAVSEEDSSDATDDDSPLDGVSADSGWCADAARIQAQVDELEAQGLPLQEQFRIQFDELLSPQLALLRSAPSAIAQDATRYADGLEEIGTRLEGVEYNLFALTEEDTAILEDPAIEASANVVEAYIEGVCQIEDLEPETADSTIRLTDDEIDALLSGPERDAVLGSLIAMGISEQEAECVMRSALGSGVDVLGNVNEELITMFGDCGISPGQLAALGLGIDESEVSAQLELLTSALTPELQQALRSSQEARDGLATVLQGQGLDAEQSTCAVEALTGVEDLSTLSDINVVIDLFVECGVSLSDLAAIG